MKKGRINIFAARADLELLMRTIESKRELQFVRTGLFDHPEQLRKLTLLDDDLGIAVKGDSNQEATYLVSNRTESIQARVVRQRKGGTKYAIDQLANPQTITFRPGGVFHQKCVIAGYVGTVSEDSGSLALFQLFNKEIKRAFIKVKSFYIGNEAGDLLDKGSRLTINLAAPKAYDLRKG